MSNHHDRHQPPTLTESHGVARGDSAVADVTHLMDQLDDLVLRGKKVPLYSGRVLVDVQEYLWVVDSLRDALPEELRQARRVVQDRQQILLAAQAEAEKILSAAKVRAEYLTGTSGLAAEARVLGEDMLRRSRDDAKRATEVADRYAMDVFDSAENALREGLNRIAVAKESMRRAR